MNKKLDFSLINKDNILSLTSNIIISVDTNGVITDINSIVEKFTGYEKGEILNKKVYKFINNINQYREIINELKENSIVYDFEIELKHKNSEKIYAICNAEIFKDKDENFIGVLIVLKDITKKKLAEINLKNRNLELEVINKELEAFAYTLSHDLSNSLSNIKVASAILSKYNAKKLDTQSLSILTEMSDTIDHITSIIKGLIDLFVLTKAELKITKINLSNIVKSILNRFKRSNKRNIDIYVQENIELYADKNMMEIVMENLLSNSWKFTKKNNITKISFSIKNIDGINYYTVKDNGIGFEEEISNKLFDPFKRFSNKNSYEGSGIGLSTVKKIIVKHQGDIKAKCINFGKDENERETLFYFALNDDIIPFSN